MICVRVRKLTNYVGKHNFKLRKLKVKEVDIQELETLLTLLFLT